MKCITSTNVRNI